MISADTLIELQRTHKVTIAALATACDLPETYIKRWRSGECDAPQWIEWTIRATAAKLRPATQIQMLAIDLRVLGVHQDRINYWCKVLQFPASARMAIAWKLHKRERPELSGHDKRVLDQVNRTRYFFVHGQWRCRPTLGRPTPAMRHKTPLHLISSGYLRKAINATGSIELHLTDKGREALYK